jgi:predicted PurR-regulated permease PerM
MFQVSLTHEFILFLLRGDGQWEGAVGSFSPVILLLLAAFIIFSTIEFVVCRFFFRKKRNLSEWILFSIAVSVVGYFCLVSLALLIWGASEIGKPCYYC